MSINSAKAYRVMQAVRGTAREVSEHATMADATKAMNTVGGMACVQNSTGRTVASTLRRSFNG